MMIAEEPPNAMEEQTQTQTQNPSSAPPMNDNSNPQQGNHVQQQQQQHGKGNQPPKQQQGTNEDNVQQPQLAQPVRIIRPASTRNDPRKLFVGGLPLNVTNHEFRTFFEQFGAILDPVVMFHRDTHRSRGFGFVTFVDPVRTYYLCSTYYTYDGGCALVVFYCIVLYC